MNIVFCDIETTGLDPQRDAIIEIALIKKGEEKAYWIELTEDELGAASAQALQVNHYYRRAKNLEVVGARCPPEDRKVAAFEIAAYTEGCVLAGNNVKFDQAFLEVWLRRHGACPAWDYHVLDVPTFAAGTIAERWNASHDVMEEEDADALREALAVPFKSRAISNAVGVTEPEGDSEHTALADARWAKAVWDAVA